MLSHTTDRLHFNFGFLLAAPVGESRIVELDYPAVKLDDLLLTPLHGKFRAQRTAQGVLIRGNLHSTIDLDCARCNDDFQQDIIIELDEHFYQPDTGPDDAPLITDTGVLDLGPLVREEAITAAPMQPVCKEDCQGLCIECGTNLNDGDCGCEDDTIDPRFAALKQLLETDNL